jgi:phosphate-selective porin OprO/OprP
MQDSTRTFLKGILFPVLLLSLAVPAGAAEEAPKVGGRIQVDWLASATGDDVEARFGALKTGAEFRRARMFIEGGLASQVKYKIEMDLAGGRVAFTDVFISLEQLPGVGTLRVGHQKEPFSLEELTSSRFITFMERALPNVFAPARNTGLLLQNAVAGERVTWAIGVFREAETSGDSIGAGGWNVTARVTGLPWYREKGRYLFHVGAAYTRKDPLEGVVRFRQRPEVHISPYLVDTGTLKADGVDIVGLESAWVVGPFSLQGEYMSVGVDRPVGGSLRFQGYYVYAGVFLTGEHRAYKKASGAFDRTKPRRNFREGGFGAWELVVRYSGLDLTDGDVQGGVLQDWTVGLNWYLNDHTRWMLNYVHARRKDVGTANYFMTRFQVDF